MKDIYRQHAIHQHNSWPQTITETASSGWRKVITCSSSAEAWCSFPWGFPLIPVKKQKEKRSFQRLLQLWHSLWAEQWTRGGLDISEKAGELYMAAQVSKPHHRRPSEKATPLSLQKLNNIKNTCQVRCLQSSLPVRGVLAGSEEAGPQEPEWQWERHSPSELNTQHASKGRLVTLSHQHRRYSISHQQHC